MPASITCEPAAPDTGDFCRVTVADADQNDLTAYNNAVYPTSPSLSYYLKFTLGGEELGRSYVFNVASDGGHEFNNYMFSPAGSWTVTLHNAATDAQVATLSVTVS